MAAAAASGQAGPEAMSVTSTSIAAAVVAALSAVLPTASGLVLGAARRGQTGMASATNSTAIQVSVAVVGSLLATRYQDRVGTALAGHHLPSPIVDLIKSSLGDVLAVAARLPTGTGPLLAQLAGGAFTSGLDLRMLAGAGVAAIGLLIAAIGLPGRSRSHAAGVS
jgi:hypothetical protein